METGGPGLVTPGRWGLVWRPSRGRQPRFEYASRAGGGDRAILAILAISKSLHDIYHPASVNDIRHCETRGLTEK
jgi:hypothetical protein